MFRKQKIFFKFINIFLLFCVLTTILVACSSRPPKIALATKSNIKRTSLETPTDKNLAPFILWSFGLSSEGTSLTDASIRRGDEFYKKGDLKGALNIYKSINEIYLDGSLQKELVLRKASAYLELNNPNGAMDSLASFFDINQLRVEAVNGDLALLLAYTYGASGDFDQSMAWFSKTSTTPSDSSTYINSAQLGARFLLNSLSSSQFESLYSRWRTDFNLGPIVEQEFTIRKSANNKNDYNKKTAGLFWLKPLSEQHYSVSIGKDIYQQPPAQIKLAVLLPLSGALAPLGESTKNGMQLAIEVENESQIEVIFKDTGDEFTEAGNENLQNIIKELIANEKVNMIVGPLLSEHATVARNVALQARVPLLSLSKANNFTTGEFIFRFGATSDSQMDTLLDSASDILRMRNFAVVYPNTSFGQEYAVSFKKYLSAKGLSLVYEAMYESKDDNQLSTIAKELERLSIDGLFIPDNLESARGLLSLLSENFRQRVRPMGSVNWESPQELAQSSAIFQDAIYVSPFFSSSPNNLIRKFVDRYRQRFGKGPDFLSAQGFDAITMVIDSARRVLRSGAPFDLALKQIENYHGLTGKMRVDVSGEVHRKYTVVQVKEGRLVPLLKDFNQNGEFGGY